MHIITRIAITISALLIALFVATGGALVLVYAAAFCGFALMAALMIHTAFVAVRSWQLDQLPGLHLPHMEFRRRDGTTRRAA